MSELSHETNRQIGVLIDRKGKVEYVMVGTAKQIELPDFGRGRVAEGRFRGLRCVHTHLMGEKLTQDDLTDLALLRLDLMSAIEVDRKTGLPGVVHTAHLVPMSDEGRGTSDEEKAYEFLEPAIPAHLDTDFGALIQSLENEMTRLRMATAKSRSGGDQAPSHTSAFQAS